MLVQHPALPFFAVTGDYYPSSSTTPSTLTQPQPPGAVFGLPLPTTAVLNHNLAFRRLATSTSDRFCRLYNTVNQSNQDTTRHSPSPYPLNPPTPSTNTMPRQPQTKVNNPEANTSTQPGPPGPIIAGGKRDASAVSGTPVVTALPAPGAQLESNDEPPIRLPPKLKESERMMHVQRWVNHLPWNGSDSSSGSSQSQWNYSYRHIDEDRELTPPPSRTYLLRLPFTPDEQQTMLRFFSTSSDYRHQQATGQLPNNYPSNLPYHNQRTAALHQASANQHPTIPPQQMNHQTGTPNDMEANQCRPNQKSGVQRRMEPEAGTGSRFFAEWETRLISHLFQDYFSGTPDALGNSNPLPSLNEVRSRIAASRLKETRTATAVRAKIKRMQSSGTWADYQ
ncbi:unnamed protein product [Calicophoron daubneyi]|uniref:Uncharacterized protein n=1 Tax=Calicophoron daubneyi TaxID=300641 RepID=A0AAV2TUR2_CALDB